MVMGEILIQTLYYAVVMILSIGFCAMMMRGFFWKYLKAKTGFGKYVMVKIRTNLRDYFAIGWVKDGFLVYKDSRIEKRISIAKGENFFYRTLGVNWVDIDEEKGALCKVNYEPVTGHDLETESNLYVRATTRPSVADNRERVILLLLIGIGIAVIIVGFLVYSNYSLLTFIKAQNVILSAKGVAVGGGSALI